MIINKVVEENPKRGNPAKSALEILREAISAINLEGTELKEAPNLKKKVKKIKNSNYRHLQVLKTRLPENKNKFSVK